MTLPAPLQQYATLAACAGATHGVDSYLVLAVMDRESEGGTAPGYHPKGPGGTGDWTARVGHWLSAPGAKAVETLPPGWYAPRHADTHEVIPGPYAIPEDELGWGRGLMQIDYGHARSIEWEDAATNIDEGARMLSLAMAEFPKSLSSAIAAYNCGAGNVRKALLLGKDADYFTTGRNYSADVLRRRAQFASEAV